ncbi:MAG: lysylphosphatidylglycerol synthase domain-containing protein, partial [Candidatus Hydromicrobium sp.]
KEKLYNVYKTLMSFKKYKMALIKVLIFSFLLQFAVILNYFLAARALGINLTLTTFIFIVPVVATIAMIPISIGGIGLRENSFVFILVAMGTANEKAALCSLLIFFMLVLVGIAGGIVYIVRPYFEGRLGKNSTG